MQRLSAPLRRAREFLREEYERAFRHEHWHVGIVDAPIQSFLEPDADPDVRWFPLPDRGTYLADPFGIARGTTIDVLLEEFDFRTNRGAISWVQAADGAISRPQSVLRFPFHASYPYLFEHRGSLFCIPETAEAREVGLYRATQFPTQWTKAGTLLPGIAAADSTVIEHDGRLWLFHTDMDDGPFSKLHVWHAPDLRGPWQPHAANPVKTDAASARPAGTPFVSEGLLYRPSQDCSKTYGGSLVLNRVVRLTPTEYREERAAVVPPFREGGLRHGIHTLAAVGRRTLVDGKRFAFNPWAMARHLARLAVRRSPAAENGHGRVRQAGPRPSPQTSEQKSRIHGT